MAVMPSQQVFQAGWRALQVLDMHLPKKEGEEAGKLKPFTRRSAVRAPTATHGILFLPCNFFLFFCFPWACGAAVIGPAGAGCLPLYPCSPSLSLARALPLRTGASQRHQPPFDNNPPQQTRSDFARHPVCPSPPHRPTPTFHHASASPRNARVEASFWIPSTRGVGRV